MKRIWNIQVNARIVTIPCFAISQTRKDKENTRYFVLCCNQSRKETRKPVNASRNQSKNVAVYSMIQNIQAHLPPMYSPNEPTPHVNTHTNLFNYLFMFMLACILCGKYL